MIESKIILDSIDKESNRRITTYVVTYPRLILAEFNTHRMLSRNSASSRAIPVKKMLDSIQNTPAMPAFWGKNQSGMQAQEELNSEQIAECEKLILEGRDYILNMCRKLQEIGLHKQTSNRYLEPWAHVTTLVTATDWHNFFALRAHHAAQPEFRDLAHLMLSQYISHQPTPVAVGEWHCPYGDNIEGISQEDKIKVAVARAARVSYTNIEGETSVQKDIELHDRLLAAGHCSPFEHAAQATGEYCYYGNFQGWKQYRKTLKGENKIDTRISN